MTMLMKMRSTGCVPAASVGKKGEGRRDMGKKISRNPEPEAGNPKMLPEALEEDGRKTPYIIEETHLRILPMERENGKKREYFFRF